MRKRRGQVLVETIVFIILNLIFLSILILFLLKQGNGASILEDNYSKQIALLIDSGKPGMIMKLDMEKAKKVAEKNGIAFEDIVFIEDNFVTVKLSDEGGTSYSFFNDVDVGSFPEGEMYVLTISSK